MTSEHLEVSLDHGVARVTFNRPEKRNAITVDMWLALTEALATFEASGDVRCLVLAGSGGSFSSGADLSAVRDADGAESPEFRQIAVDGMQAVADFPLPTVAVIEGAAVGAGALIAVSCDVRFALPSAVFAVPAVRYGYEVESTSLVRLVEAVGPAQANRFLLSGMRLDATEAARIGMVQVCAEDAEAQASSYVEGVLSGDPATTLSTRTSIRRAVEGRTSS